ncbi:MAG: hypothetical protein ACLT78_07850 [Escherichia coli]
MRYFICQPLQWTEEMSGMLMIWVVMLVEWWRNVTGRT